MNEYFENLNETIKEYFKVLSDEIPDCRLVNHLSKII